MSFRSGGPRDLQRTYGQGGNDRFYGGGDRVRGRGGFRGGGRGGGRGGRGGPSRPRPESIDVKTNFFRVHVDIPEVYQYYIQILPAEKRRVKNSAGEDIKDSDGNIRREIRIKTGKSADKIAIALQRGSNALTRRILARLQQDLRVKENKLLVTDGSALGYAPSPLFTESDIQKDPKQEEEKDSSVGDGGGGGRGIYGGADDGSHVNHPQAPSLKLSKAYVVQVKRNCDENDPMQDRARSDYYVVKLTFSDKIPVHSSTINVSESQQLVDGFRLTQCVDTLIKNAMMTNMIASGRSPKIFYFNEADHSREIVGRNLHDVYYSDYGKSSRSTFGPLVGLTQAFRYCQAGNAFLSVDSAVSWFHREHYHNSKTPVGILDDIAGTLAGVRIPGGLFRPITDEKVRVEVRERLSKLMLHVKYEKPWQENDWVKKKRNDGYTDEAIKRMNVVVRRNVRMLPGRSKDDGAIMPEIFWSADNPDDYNFTAVRRKPRKKQDEEGNVEGDSSKQEQEEEPEPVVHTVFSYFQERYGIKLRFPKMPLIHTGRGEYYPVEFISQAREKVIGANDPDKIKHVLNFNDEFASTDRIDHIERLRSMANKSSAMGLSLEQLMKQFNIRVDTKAEQFRAVVLPEPTLKFSNGDASIRNGSWNLNGVRFASPADLSSYAVIDLGVSKGKKSAQDFMISLFRTMRGHDMKVPDYFEHFLSKLTVRGRSEQLNPGQLYECFDRAMTQARSTFLEMPFGFYTNVSFSDGSLRQCVVMRDRTPKAKKQTTDEFIAILNHKDAPTHWIVNKKNGKGEWARIQFIDESRSIHDPWEPKAIEKAKDLCYVIIRETNKTFRRLAGADPIGVKEIEASTAVHALKRWQVECPSMVFVYLPSDNKENYHFIKLLSQWKFEVNCQCIVQENYSNQRQEAQYCSNVALKVNTKLFSYTNDARAWATYDRRLEEGIPWITELPTLVMGLALSHGIGQAGNTVVAASACLDAGCMQMSQELKVQAKSDVVNGRIMVDIVKSLAIQYYQHRHQKPKRVMVYRDGASDGRFDEIIRQEVAAIRRAFYELNMTSTHFQCPNESSCKKNGCIFCTPPIAFIVAQNDHNIRIVPAKPLHRNKDNVPSGTVVDSIIMSFQNGMKISANETAEMPTTRLFGTTREGGFDFLLTAQGGLKGTSKPVYYRILLNENYFFKPDQEGKATPLTKETLQQVTYFMAFQYGTATKAPRKVPVILYSERLATVAIGYIGYLFGRKDCNADLGVTVKHGIEDPNRLCRNDMDTGSLSEVKNELLKCFGPFEQECTESLNNWRVPFRPHIAG